MRSGLHGISCNIERSRGGGRGWMTRAVASNQQGNVN